MTDFILRTYLTAQTNLSDARDSFIERSKDQSGAEAVQVIMIMGIMAVLVIAVMAVVGGGIKTLGNNVKDCIMNITGADATCKWGS